MSRSTRPRPCTCTRPTAIVIWFIRLLLDCITVTDDRDGDEADCTVRAPASDCYLLLWNRRDANGSPDDG